MVRKNTVIGPKSAEQIFCIQYDCHFDSPTTNWAERMFKKADGIEYNRFLRRLHETCLLDWYLEIGCRAGRVLSHARGKTIAVDPFFKMERNIVGEKPSFFAFQTTSDDFFRTEFLKNNEIRLSFSFLDGMHLFEYLLRDFSNVEMNSSPGAAIALHDCCPYSLEMTTRDLGNLPKTAWTGDVWKLIPILRTYRPDLRLDVVGCAPTGLVIVSQLDPKSSVLRENYEAIVAEFSDLDLEAFGINRFFESFEYLSAQDIIRGGFDFLNLVKLTNLDQTDRVWISP